MSSQQWSRRIYCTWSFLPYHHDKDIQIGNVHCRLSRRLCLSNRDHDAGEIFRCFKWFLFITNELVLTYHVNFWAAVHNDLPVFVVTISKRCDNLLLNMSVRWLEEIFKCLKKTTTLYLVCANPKRSCEQFPNVCTTFEPLIRDNILMSSFPTLRRKEFLEYLTQFVDSDPSFSNWAAWLLHVLVWHPMFWRLTRNYFAFSVRLWPVQKLEHTPGAKFATSFFWWEDTLVDATITHITFFTFAFLENESRRRVFPCRKSRSFRESCSQDLTSASAAPETRFSNCPSREEKCFSRISVRDTRHPAFSIWCSLQFHSFEQHVSWMYSDKNGFHNSNCSNWRFYRFSIITIGFLHGDDGFVQSHVERLQSRVERLHVVTFQSDVDNLIDVQKQTHLCRWPSNSCRSSKRLVCPWDNGFLFVNIVLQWRPQFRNLNWWESWSRLLSQSQEPRKNCATIPNDVLLTSSIRQWTSRTQSRWSKPLLQTNDLHRPSWNSWVWPRISQIWPLKSVNLLFQRFFHLSPTVLAPPKEKSNV